MVEKQGGTNLKWGTYPSYPSYMRIRNNVNISSTPKQLDHVRPSCVCMGSNSWTKWPLLMTLVGGITCVLGSDVLPLSSFMLSNSWGLSKSSTILIMGVKQLWSVVMLLGAREVSLYVGITLTSHGGYPCTDSIATNN
jgi:hypothetical protein